MVKREHKIVIASLIAALSLWVIDAIIDSQVFSHETFLNSLILNPSLHEIYFRAIFVSGFVAFGIISARMLANRRQIEQELHLAIEKLEVEKAKSEAIVAAIGDGISIQDMDYRVIYQNQVHRGMIGGNKIGERCYQAYSHSDVICPGCPVDVSFKDNGIHTLEKTIFRGSEKRYIEIKSSPLIDAAGTIIAGIEAVRDITDRKTGEEKLHLYSQAIHEAMDGVQIVDLDGTAVYSNKAVEEIYGYTSAELQGMHINDMNADRDFAGRVILPAINEFSRWSGELIVVHKTGREFPVWLSASLVKNDFGRPIAMIGIIRDITKRKEIEEELSLHREQLTILVNERTAELSMMNDALKREIDERVKMEDELVRAQKLESLGILAGGIAHDFNNLLSSIAGNISLAMLDVNKGDSAYQQLASAENAAFRARDLTQQLLTFSKGGAPIKTITSLAELVNEAVGFSLRGSNVRCDISLPGDLWFCEVDPGQMSQVINNLVINADHAMPQGGTVNISCENLTIGPHEHPPLNAGHYVRVSVQDYGIGIAKDHIQKIFDPYFTTKQRGSGLGLATSYAIMQKHGGHISVESELGAGSTFHLYIPASPEKSVSRKAEEGNLLRGEGKILVMDDEEEVRHTTGAVLRMLGYIVEFAEDGNQAISTYREAMNNGEPFAVVIMDLTIPGGMGGRETIKVLQEIDPDIRAIVSSGYSNDPIMAAYRSYGFHGMVTKPYRIKDLSRTVYEVINPRV